MSNNANANRHTVRAGETLTTIARQHGVTLRALLAANPQIADPDRIRVGQVINLPAGQIVIGPAPDTPPATRPVPPAVGSPSAALESEAFAAMDARGKARRVHPILRERLALLAVILAGRGMRTLITDGLRTFAEQDRLFRIGRPSPPPPRVTNARGGQSNHNFGLAVDMYPVLPGPSGQERVFTEIPRNASVEFARAFNRTQRSAGEEAERLGLFWGARFSGIVDTPHIQLLAQRDLSPAECLRIFNRNGGDLDPVWAEASRRVRPLPS